jgi:hypothetical protein
MMIAALVGVMRQVSALKNGRADAYGSDGKKDWQYHIEGCLGEYALARHLGLFWDGKIGDLSPGDVGKIECRTRSEDWHDLILHDTDKDPDTATFFLLTGRNGSYEIRGTILGSEGKQRRFWKDPAGKKDPARKRPAYFVPQSELTKYPPEEGEQT